MKSKIILLAIILLGIFVRFVYLDKFPVSLNWDEVSQGYNALSILKTGHDDWGQFMPITNFRAYGDYPTTLYMYLTVPLVALFGLNETTVRLPSALFGSLLPLIIYFFCQFLFKKKSISLMAAFLVALSPWSVFLSRQAIQTTPAALLLTLGIYLFIQGIKRNNSQVIWGTIVLGLSTYAYHNTRIFTPIFFVVLLLHYRRYFLNNFKKTFIIVFIAAAFFLPVTLAVLSPEGSARSNWVGILDQGAINDINSSRGASKLPPAIAKLVHNKVTYFIPKAFVNYLGYFSPKFLALSGGTQFQFNLQGFGIINPLDYFLLIIGLWAMLFQFHKLDQEKKVVLYWLLLGPIPAAITRDPYQVVRSTTMLPAVYLVCAFGLTQLVSFTKNWSKFKKLISLGIVVLLYFVWFGFYLNNLLFVYKDKYSQAWQYGYKQAIQVSEENYSRFSHIAFTKNYGEAHEFVLFFKSFDPNQYQHDPHLVRYPRSNWFWVDSFDKYLFINDWEVKEKSKTFKDTLLITTPGNYDPRGKLIKTINFLDGTPVFDIVAY